MKRYLIPILVLLIFSSCGEEVAEEEQSTTEIITPTHEDVSDLNGYYKRYVGTVANVPVTVNLVQYENSISGTYYYDKIGNVITLYGSSKEDTTTGKTILTENVTSKEENSNAAKWLLEIGDGVIVGDWVDERTHKAYKIDLKEDYTNSVQLGVLFKQDDRHYKDDDNEPHATNEYQYLFPKQEADKYIFTAISKLIACDASSRTALVECIDKKNKEYYDLYFKDLADMEEQGIYEKGYALNYGATENHFVYYNTNGWLCISAYLWLYTGGAHGNYSNTFTCIDVEGARIWSLGDVVTDKNALLPIIEKDVRKQFEIKKGEPLNSRLLIDELHITDNFFLTDKGLTFVYTPYEIASYADGEVSVFVPYEQIKEMLTTAFKNRMHMNNPV